MCSDFFDEVSVVPSPSVVVEFFDINPLSDDDFVLLHILSAERIVVDSSRENCIVSEADVLTSGVGF